MRFSVLAHKISNRWKKIRLQPIHVFCFHHVAAVFDASSMNKGDWMSADKFKSKVMEMKQNGIEFINLSQAYHHIYKDLFRSKRYAVITFDDGYASLKEILPWLAVQHIPVVLFLNGKYIDGHSYRKNPKEQYLTKEELFCLTTPLIEIGSHGWEHTDASNMGENEFADYINRNVQLLKRHPRFVPFHAYTWGRHTEKTDEYLKLMKITPVYMDGMKNYNDSCVIHREIFEETSKKQANI